MENWKNEHIASDSIKDAIDKAIAKQTNQYEPAEIEVRKAELEIETTEEP